MRIYLVLLIAACAGPFEGLWHGTRRLEGSCADGAAVSSATSVTGIEVVAVDGDGAHLRITGGCRPAVVTVDPHVESFASASAAVGDCIDPVPAEWSGHEAPPTEWRPLLSGVNAQRDAGLLRITFELTDVARDCRALDNYALMPDD